MVLEMAKFDLQESVAARSLEVFEKYRKDDLLEVAAHYIHLSKSG